MPTFEDNIGLVVSTVARLGVSRRHREDAQQEGMIALLNACKAFDPNAGVQFSTFAVKAITNAVFNYLRGEGRSKGRIDRLMDATTPEMLEASPVEMTDGVLKALAQLDSRTQQIVRMRHLEGLTLEAVADRVGLGKSRVQVLEKQGLERLREILGK